VKSFFTIAASAALALALSTPPVAAGMINFDDLMGSTVGSSYGGFTWGANWDVESRASLGGYGDTAAFPSGANAAFNGGGVSVIDLLASTPTVFNGASFLSWGSNNGFAGYSSTTITVQGWNGTSLLWTASEALSPSTFTDLAFGTAAVTDLKFLGSAASRWWLVDNISFGAAAVPEPGTLVLLATGLLALGLFRRRKSRPMLPALFGLARLSRFRCGSGAPATA